MSRLCLDILGIAETHWNAETPESWEQDGYVIFSSSRKDQTHRQGAAIIVKKELAQNVTDYQSISERLISIKIDTKNGPITVFQVYAPDSSYSDIDVDIFFETLQVEINNLPKKNKYFILGDFNDKIGRHAYWYFIGTNFRGEIFSRTQKFI